jgi:hypothetical protein
LTVGSSSLAPANIQQTLAFWLCRSLYENPELGGCLPKAWYDRYQKVPIPLPLPIPITKMTQMYANEDPKDTSQPHLVRGGRMCILRMLWYKAQQLMMQHLGSTICCEHWSP